LDNGLGPETDELEPVTERAGSAKTRPRGRWWRGLTGSLAAGLVVLALIVLGAGLFSSGGPGTAALIAHPAAAIVALGGQWVADRRQGRAAGAGGLVVLAAAAFVLCFYWWF
jgi:hypothetical protein